MQALHAAMDQGNAKAKLHEIKLPLEWQAMLH
jgi:hypothetical protein